MRLVKGKKILVIGATAMDFIGSYPDEYEHYQREYQPKNFNISLQLSGLERFYGGCAMNIAYGLARLNVQGIPFSIIGSDFFDGYQEHICG